MAFGIVTNHPLYVQNFPDVQIKWRRNEFGNVYTVLTLSLGRYPRPRRYYGSLRQVQVSSVASCWHDNVFGLPHFGLYLLKRVMEEVRAA